MVTTIPGSEVLTSGLNMIAQSLQIPVIIFLVVFAFFAILTLGSLVSEYTSRKKITPDSLEKLIYSISKATSSDELMNLISSTSVSNEQISSDTYSANITMVVDNMAAKKWLDRAGIQNWIPLEETSEKFMVLMVVPNGLADWAELKH